MGETGFVGALLISWSWVWVLSPAWISAAVALVILAAVLAFSTKNWSWRR